MPAGLTCVPVLVYTATHRHIGSLAARVPDLEYHRSVRFGCATCVFHAHTLSFDFYQDGAACLRREFACRAVRVCEHVGTGTCSQSKGCTNARHATTPFMYHHPGNIKFEIYDEESGYHPTLDPVLHGVEFPAPLSVSDSDDDDAGEC